LLRRIEQFPVARFDGLPTKGIRHSHSRIRIAYAIATVAPLLANLRAHSEVRWQKRYFDVPHQISFRYVA
jgi:hypothetical protein